MQFWMMAQSAQLYFLRQLTTLACLMKSLWHANNKSQCHTLLWFFSGLPCVLCHFVQSAFTASRLSLTAQSYPVLALQKCYGHLQGLPFQSFDKVYPLLLIGADNT